MAKPADTLPVTDETAVALLRLYQYVYLSDCSSREEFDACQLAAEKELLRLRLIERKLDG